MQDIKRRRRRIREPKGVLHALAKQKRKNLAFGKRRDYECVHKGREGSSIVQDKGR
jgi:hypothetical protein